MLFSSIQHQRKEHYWICFNSHNAGLKKGTAFSCYTTCCSQISKNICIDVMVCRDFTITAMNIQTDSFSQLYLPLAFPPYLLSPETMMSLPDRELHLSTLARLYAQNATHPLLIIVYWTTSNRCDCFLLLWLSCLCIVFYFITIVISLLKSSSFS